MDRAKSRGSPKKPKPKTPKQQIADLTLENENLNKRIEELTNNYNDVHIKLTEVTKPIASSLYPNDNIDPMTLTKDALLHMVTKVIVKKRTFDQSPEGRVEELENRITIMSLQLAKYTKKCEAYEQNLGEILETADSEHLKDKITKTMMIAGQSYNTFEENFLKLDIENETDECCANFDRILKERSISKDFKLIPPKEKLPGETHISDIDKDLYYYIILDISAIKYSGANWKLLAQRLDIDSEKIDQWEELNLEFPMRNVLSEWSTDKYASIRSLHRHLMSPQMKCIRVAHAITQFYNVT